MAVSLYEEHRPRENRITVSASPLFSGDYVAVGADMQVEIIAAFTELSAGRIGKETVKCIGDFTIDDPILVPDYTILDLSEARVFLANGSDCNIIENSVAGGNTYIEISGGVLDGNGANQGGGAAAIYMSNVTNSFIEGVIIEDVYASGIHFVNTSTYNVIDKVYLNTGGAGAVGIWFQNASTYNTVSNCIMYNIAYGYYSQVSGCENLFVNCLAYDCTIYGFNISGSSAHLSSCSAKYNPVGYYINGTDHTFSSCQASYNLNYGFQVLASAFVNVLAGCCAARNGNDGTTTGGGYNYYILGNDNVITGCNANHSYQGVSLNGVGIYVTGYRNTITGCTIYENPVNPNAGITGYGIVIDEGDENVVSSNIIYGSDGDGIFLTAAENNKLIGNSITDNTAYGIQLDAASLENQIQGNYTDGNATACARINNANCLRNIFTGNLFDEGNISDVGGAHLCVAYNNIDPSAGNFIAKIGTAIIAVNTTVFVFGVIGGVTLNQTNYPVPGSGTWAEGATELQLPLTHAGILRNLYVYALSGPGAGETDTITVRRNAGATAITCNITGAGAQTCNDVANIQACVAGDRIGVEYAADVTACASSDVMIAVEYEFEQP